MRSQSTCAWLVDAMTHMLRKAIVTVIDLYRVVSLYLLLWRSPQLPLLYLCSSLEAVTSTQGQQTIHLSGILYLTVSSGPRLTCIS